MPPDVLMLHGFPPETSGTPADLAAKIQAERPGIDLRLTTDYADAAEAIADAEVVIEHGLEGLLDRGGSLRWVQSLSAGVDRYDLDALADRGVALTTVSGVHAPAVAEHVLACMLYFERGLGRAARQARRGAWRRFAAGELGGKTAGVVGAGAIGGRVAEIATALGMQVVATKRDPSTAPDAVDEIYGSDGLHALLGESDYVVLACPLTDETEGLIDARALSSMDEKAVLINVARGRVVEHGALVDALQGGYLGGAALDVTHPEPLPADSPLWELENVLITPHMAGGSPRFPERCADVFLDNYDRYLEGDLDAMRNRVV